MKKINLSLIFGAERDYLIQTLSFLKADALSYSERLKINLYGVHYKEIDKRGFLRGLLLKENLEIKEKKFIPSLIPDAIWILHLPRDEERFLHQNISLFFKKFPLLQINPYLSTKRAEDKFRTLNLWLSRGLSTPGGIIIRKKEQKEKEDKLKRFLKKVNRPLYLQPNKGTEGRDTFRVECAKKREIISLIDYLLLEDDVLIREERGNLFYFKEKERGMRRVVFRINVGYNGKKFIADSGFAEVCLEEKSFITSPERGGEIKSINEVLANLYFIQRGRKYRFIPHPLEIEKIKETAETSLLALNWGLNEEEFLKFAGVDLLLEVNGKGKLNPLPLEINPRPAGLNHSEEIKGISQDLPRRKITSSLFELLQGNVGNYPQLTEKKSPRYSYK